MNEKVLKWLFDIKIAIEEINSYFVKYDRTFKEYQNNLVLKRAIERNLEIIGEAVNKIIKVEPDIEISNAKRIIGLRNQIIHAYDNISDENIWGIVIKHLPRLEQDINKLIANRSEVHHHSYI